MGEVRRPAFYCFISAPGVRCERSKHVRELLIILGAILIYPLSNYAQLREITDSIPLVEMDYLDIAKSPTRLDSLTLLSPNKSIGDVLLENTNVQIKQSGGRGAIQSLKIRGFSSTQNQVNWNGLPINSLTLGMFDLAGSSIGVFDELQLINGSSGVEYGGGAIGGVIDLKNNASWNEGVNLSVGGSVGSFNSNMDSYKLSYSSNKFSYGLMFMNEFVKNDYDFINNEILGKPRETQKHAQFWNSNLVQEVYYRNGKNKLKWVTWLQGRKKNTPKILSANRPSKNSTADSSIRQIISYTRVLKNSILDASYGYAGNGFNYWDHNNSIFTDYYISEHFALLKYRFGFRKINFRIKSRIERQSVKNNRYEGTPKRTQSFNTIFANYSVKPLFKIYTVFGGQTSTSPASIIPITSVGYKFTNKKQYITLKGSTSNHFLYPSFNDLFWDAGGNDSLKPEEGWNAEQSIKFHKNKFSVYAEVYYSNINNWIQWSPSGSMWTPQNIKGVLSYGGELNLNYSLTLKKVDLKVKTGVAYTRTTVTESLIKNDPAIGNQATYVPFINTNSSLIFAWKDFVFRYQMLYRGKQYTSVDNKERTALAAYFMNNVSVWRKTKVKSFSFLVKGEIQNVFDTIYSVDRSYAMPGRAFYLTLILNFNLHTPKKGD